MISPLDPIDTTEYDWQGCTGVAAVWCPVHGDCTCPHFNPDGGARDQGGEHPCPLHEHHSTHAIPPEASDVARIEAALARAKERVAMLEAMAATPPEVGGGEGEG